MSRSRRIRSNCTTGPRRKKIVPYTDQGNEADDRNLRRHQRWPVLPFFIQPVAACVAKYYFRNESSCDPPNKRAAQPAVRPSRRGAHRLATADPGMEDNGPFWIAKSGPPQLRRSVTAVMGPPDRLAETTTPFCSFAPVIHWATLRKNPFLWK